MPSELEPYSPEIALLLPLLVCGSVKVPACVAVLPPAPSWNCCKTIGEAVSRPAPAYDGDTVLITRSPPVNQLIGSAIADCVAINAPRRTRAEDTESARGDV
jgi:hypothetical protein